MHSVSTADADDIHEDAHVVDEFDEGLAALGGHFEGTDFPHGSAVDGIL